MTTAPLWVHARAPFAAYRWLQAGVYRASAPTIPPSAAWGLLLNLAGIETRAAAGDDVSTGIRPDAPALRLAIGLVRPVGVAKLLQQLHTYPVGSSGKELKSRTHGAKYWIAPVRREVLVDLDAILGVEGPPEVLQRIRDGLGDAPPGPRYGVPFAGDNSFFFERLDVVERPPAVRWYTPVVPGEPPREGSARVTVAIDRAESSRTTTRLVAPDGMASELPPDAAWTWVPGPPG
ncbi:MAG: CRISPR-associated protein Cas5 [Sandaracinaceae bacterium]|nr:CRISPR-associated protein Cas5 [Sandaracinaceae bacterium]